VPVALAQIYGHSNYNPALQELLRHFHENTFADITELIQVIDALLYFTVVSSPVVQDLLARALQEIRKRAARITQDEYNQLMQRYPAGHPIQRSRLRIFDTIRQRASYLSV